MLPSPSTPHFRDALYLTHPLPTAGRVASPCPAQHQPLLTDPGDPDRNTLVLHFVRSLVLTPQRTALSQAGAGEKGSRAIPASAPTHACSLQSHMSPRVQRAVADLTALTAEKYFQCMGITTRR